MFQTNSLGKKKNPSFDVAAHKWRVSRQFNVESWKEKSSSLVCIPDVATLQPGKETGKAQPIREKNHSRVSTLSQLQWEVTRESSGDSVRLNRK